jgi:hypothetical protein
MNDLVGGHVDFLCEQSVSVAEQINARTINSYAVGEALLRAAGMTVGRKIVRSLGQLLFPQMLYQNPLRRRPPRQERTLVTANFASAEPPVSHECRLAADWLDAMLENCILYISPM